jgi:RNA polymerase sigma factor (sigma-70 family)
MPDQPALRQIFSNCKLTRSVCILVSMLYQNPQLIRTRSTLIKRLKNWQDQASWQDFFDTYRNLIFGVAVNSGLTSTEAQDVVQETMYSVAKHMPNFNYDRTQGSFKTWLLTMTHWRISDQFRKRNLTRPARSQSDNYSNSGDVAALEDVADAKSLDMESLLEEEWKNSLFEAAMTRVRRSVDPQRYQIFDLFVNKEWAAARIAERYGISVGLVHVTKHRVTEAIKEEVERLKIVMT